MKNFDYLLNSDFNKVKIVTDRSHKAPGAATYSWVGPSNEYVEDVFLRKTTYGDIIQIEKSTGERYYFDKNNRILLSLEFDLYYGIDVKLHQYGEEIQKYWNSRTILCEQLYINCINNFLYDVQNNLVKKTFDFQGDGKGFTVYRNKKKVCKIINSEYEYTPCGTNAVYYDYKDMVEFSYGSNYTEECSYDEKGNLIKRITRYMKSLIHTSEYEYEYEYKYDEKGKIVEEIVQENSGVPVKTLYKNYYNAFDKLFSNELESGIFHRFYNEKDDLVFEISVNPETRNIAIEEYNWYDYNENNFMYDSTVCRTKFRSTKRNIEILNETRITEENESGYLIKCKVVNEKNEIRQEYHLSTDKDYLLNYCEWIYGTDKKLTNYIYNANKKLIQSIFRFNDDRAIIETYTYTIARSKEYDNKIEVKPLNL